MNDSDATACKKLVENLMLLNADLKVPSPRSLGKIGGTDIFNVMAAQSIASGSPQNNPKVPTQQEIVQLYQDIW